MSCNLTPNISALLDGESTPEETRKLEAHLQTCSACQSAHADFQLLSQQIASYSYAPNGIAQQQTLAEVFRAAESPAPSPPQRTAAAISHHRFTFPARVGSFNGALALLFLCLTATTASLYFLTRNTDPVRPIAQAPAPSDKLFTGGDTERPMVAHARQDQSQAVASIVSDAVRRPRATRNLVTRPREQRSTVSESIEAGMVASDLADSSADGSAISPGRHVEQAITLLSSFRNARPDEAMRGFDLAHEKRKSQKLIYQNVVLRREAANEGDVATESLLQNLEPILIDIAHLPEKPARNEVLSIKDRMQRKSIVAMLRASQSGHTQEF